MCGGCRLREQCTHSSMGRSLKHHLCQDELDSCSGANRPDAARCRLSVGCDGSNKIAVTGRPHFAQLYFCSDFASNLGEPTLQPLGPTAGSGLGVKQMPASKMSHYARCHAITGDICN